MSRSVADQLSENIYAAVPSSDALQSLNLLAQVSKIAGKGTEDLKIYEALAKEDTMYFRRAAQMLTDTPELKRTFGAGMEGALGLAQVLKERYGQATLEDILDEAWRGDSDIAEKRNAVLGKLAKNSAFVKTQSGV